MDSAWSSWRLDPREATQGEYKVSYLTTGACGRRGVCDEL